MKYALDSSFAVDPQRVLGRVVPQTAFRSVLVAVPLHCEHLD